MTIQTSYTETAAAGYPGLVANMEKSTIISRSVEGALSFGGVVAVRGTDPDNQATVPTAAGASVLGIPVVDRAAAPVEGGVTAYADKATASILTSGVIWVTATRAVTAGDAATFLVTDGTLGADAADATHDPIPGAVWDSTAGAGEIAKLRIA